MKRIYFTMIALLVLLPAVGANIEKQYKWLIENYDVANETKTVAEEDSILFWKAMLDNNPLYLKFTKDIRKNKGSEKEAVCNTSKLPRFYPQFDEPVVEPLQGFCDSLLMDMGIACLPLNCSLHVIDSPEANSYNVLTEDGFAMSITPQCLKGRPFRFFRKKNTPLKSADFNVDYRVKNEE